MRRAGDKWWIKVLVAMVPVLTAAVSGVFTYLASR